MAWLVAIVAGALIGWIASMIMGTDNEMGWISNVLVGILGAVLGRWLFGSVLGIGSAASAGAFSLLGILWGILGAVILIGILRSVRALR